MQRRVVGERNDKVAVAIMGSGAGSNARAILEYQRSVDCSFNVQLIVSNRPEAGILGVAQEFGIRSEVLAPRAFPSDDDFAQAMKECLDGIDLVVLAGYLLKVPSAVVRLFPNRILNVHPALLPKYGGKGMYGMHVHRAVLAAGERCSGATIHIVTDEYDAGPIVEQMRVPINRSDTPESLMERVQAAEHFLYPRVIERYSRNLLVWRA